MTEADVSAPIADLGKPTLRALAARLERFALATHGMRVLSAAVLLLLLLCGEGIVQLDHSRRIQAANALATAEASNLRGRLETELNSTLFLSSGLVAYVSSVEARLDETRITALLEALYRTGRNIRNIAVAPNNHVSWVYPLKGNERALGLHYPDNPEQWPSVQRAMAARSTLVAGPLTLVQGGQGLIARTPVFSQDGSYWGLLSMVIDWDSLRRHAGLVAHTADYSIALRGRDGLGAQGAVFFGDASVFAHTPVIMTLRLPGGTWEIGVAPLAGWHAATRPPPWARPAYALLACIVSILLFSLLRDAAERRRNHARLAAFNLRLEERVNERTQDLQATNQTLETALKTLHETQHELIRNEKMAALGSLVAGVAHELNTPLGNTMLAATTLEELARRLREGETALTRSQWRKALADITEASAMIHGNVSRAASLVASFKQVAADRSSEQRRVFRLDELTDNLVAMMQPTLRRARVRVERELPAIELDSYPGLLDQVLMNLLLNAVTHAFPAGQDGLVTIAGFAEGENKLRLVITDDGVGMSREVQDRVFDPFFTTRLGQGGTGLGLHIVFNVVTGPLGGSISVASEPGAGTSFTLLLPLRAPERKSPQSL